MSNTADTWPAADMANRSRHRSLPRPAWPYGSVTCSTRLISGRGDYLQAAIVPVPSQFCGDKAEPADCSSSHLVLNALEEETDIAIRFFKITPREGWPYV